MTVPAYPFDPTGLKAENRITGEQHILTVVNEKHYSKIVPRWAPFFRAGLAIRIRLPDNTVRTLVEGEDYYLGHQFLSATRATAKPVYGSINFVDRTLQGAVIIDSYQTVGGSWTQSETKIAQILADQIYNPRIVLWEHVVDLPYAFPVINHEWDIVDMVGMSDIAQKLSEITDAVAASSDSGLLDHIANTNNPHNVTKAQVGLGQVQNYPAATEAQAREGNHHSSYMTPLRTAQAIETQAGSVISAHINDTDNPHDITPVKIGAVSLSDFANQMAEKLGRGEAASDSNMFGGMTVAQFISTTLTGTAANSTNFAGMSVTEFRDYVLGHTAYNAERFGGMTLEEHTTYISTVIGDLEFLPGTATNSLRLEGYSYQDILDTFASIPADNAIQLEGHTLAQIYEAVELMTVDNANHFNGMTPKEIAPILAELNNHQFLTGYQTVGNYARPGAGQYYVKVGEIPIPHDVEGDPLELSPRALDVVFETYEGTTHIERGRYRILAKGYDLSVQELEPATGVLSAYMTLEHEFEPYEDDFEQQWTRGSIYLLVDDTIERASIYAQSEGLVIENYNIGTTYQMYWLPEPYFEHEINKPEVIEPDPTLQIDHLEGVLEPDETVTLPYTQAMDAVINTLVRASDEPEGAWYSSESTLTIAREEGLFIITNESSNELQWKMNIIHYQY